MVIPSAREIRKIYRASRTKLPLKIPGVKLVILGTPLKSPFPDPP